MTSSGFCFFVIFSDFFLFDVLLIYFRELSLWSALFSKTPKVYAGALFLQSLVMVLDVTASEGPYISVSLSGPKYWFGGSEVRESLFDLPRSSRG